MPFKDRLLYVSEHNVNGWRSCALYTAAGELVTWWMQKSEKMIAGSGAGYEATVVYKDLRYADVLGEDGGWPRTIEPRAI